MEGENTEDGLKSKLIEVNSSVGATTADTSATPVLVLSTMVVICGAFVCGFTSGYSSPAESGIMEDLGMTVAEYSVFGSILNIGGVIGSLFNGKMADLIGRRGTMWVSEFFFIVGWFAIAFTQVAWLLDLGRLLVGIGFGILIFVVPVYIAEITPKNIRGGFTYSNQFMVTCGFALAYFLGAVISWRYLALVGAVPCVLHAVGLFFIPESPRWLAKIGREIELEETLQRLRGKNVDVSQEAAGIIEYTATFERHSEARLLDLFQRRHARAVVIGVGMMLLQQFMGQNAIGYYMSSIFEEADFPTKIGLVSAAIIQIPSVLISMLLTDKCGRRPLLMVAVSVLGFSCFLMGLAFCFQAREISSIMVYIGLLGYSAAVAFGISGLPWVIVSEIFPINIKGTAGSLVTLAHWCSSWAVSYAFNFVMEWSSSGTFFILCGVCLVSDVLTAKFVPETKGRVLEEVQASISHFSPPEDA